MFHGDGKMQHASGMLYVGQWLHGFPSRLATKMVIMVEESPMIIRQGQPFKIAIKCQDDEGNDVLEGDLCYEIIDDNDDHHGGDGGEDDNGCVDNTCKGDDGCDDNNEIGDGCDGGHAGGVGGCGDNGGVCDGDHDVAATADDDGDILRGS